MAERAPRHFRVLFVVVLVYLVIVNAVAYWQRKNGDHFYVCVSPSQQAYLVAHATCSKGECTSEEVDATGVVRMSAEYTAGSVYNNTTDTSHSGCVEITAEEAEALAPVAAHGAAVSAEEAGFDYDFDAHTGDFAYIRKIETVDGVRMITFDPMTLSTHPGETFEQGWVMGNDDTTTVTLPMDENAGPFLITYNGGGDAAWRTLDDEQLNALLAGDVSQTDLANYSPDYYAPDLSNEFAVFHVVQKSGKVTKVIQKYFP